MKVQHKTSKQIISVPNQHGNMLLGQGWEEYQDISHAVQNKKEETAEEVVDKPKRGRPVK